MRPRKILHLGVFDLDLPAPYTPEEMALRRFGRFVVTTGIAMDAAGRPAAEKCVAAYDTLDEAIRHCREAGLSADGQGYNRVEWHTILPADLAARFDAEMTLDGMRLQAEAERPEGAN